MSASQQCVACQSLPAGFHATGTGQQGGTDSGPGAALFTGEQGADIRVTATAFAEGAFGGGGSPVSGFLLGLFLGTEGSALGLLGLLGLDYGSANGCSTKSESEWDGDCGGHLTTPYGTYTASSWIST
jgi:hypothetical protein